MLKKTKFEVIDEEEYDKIIKTIRFCADNDINPYHLLSLVCKFMLDTDINDMRATVCGENDVFYTYKLECEKSEPMEEMNAEIIELIRSKRSDPNSKGKRKKKSTLLH